METDRVVYLEQGYFLERFDGEISVYHPTLTTSLYLNESGALIWELCDGSRTIDDISGLLGELYPEHREQIHGEVSTLVGSLIEHGVASLGQTEPQ